MRRRDGRDGDFGMHEGREVGKGLRVDQLYEGLAHPRIVERLERIIENDALPTTGCDLRDMRGVAVPEAVLLLRRPIVDGVDRAALPPGDRRRILRDDSEDRAV